MGKYSRAPSRPTTRRARAAQLRLEQEATVRTQVNACAACSLADLSATNKWHHVPWSGKRSHLAVIGEAPGKNEALQGEPFVGRAGAVLEEGLKAAEMTRDDVWLMNTIACRPPKNDFDAAINAGAVDACRPNFNAQLDLSGAWFVILAGRNAYQAVMEEDVPIGRVRGRLQWFHGRLWLPIWHPAYVLRSGWASEVGDQFLNDWRLVQRVLTGGEAAPDLGIVKTLGEGATDDAGEQMGLLHPGETMTERIERQGWVLLDSELVGDTMLIVDRSKKPKLPKSVLGIPQYTTDELWRLGLGEGKGLTVTGKELRRIHMLKKIVKVEVVA